jgi:nucleoside 2-deoxyribosyltransferase
MSLSLHAPLAEIADKQPPRIYWANALFSEADRIFNAECAKRLRLAGYKVFLPQEARVNRQRDTTPADIFRLDTAQILNSDLIVVCLDQETIDCGVACEAGIAYAFNIPLLGLYTDIRQHRHGLMRMYKNPYIWGMLHLSGTILASFDALLATLPRSIFNAVETSQTLSRVARAHYSRVSPKSYARFIRKLESWYNPSWDAMSTVSRWVRASSAERVLEFGCGPGVLGGALSKHFPSLSYIGFDMSRAMIANARTMSSNSRCYYTSSLVDLHKRIPRGSVDLVLAMFVLHDIADWRHAIGRLAQYLRPDGILGIIDLSTQDLPRLTDNLRRFLARPLLCRDNRIDMCWLQSTVPSLGLQTYESSRALLKVRFPDRRCVRDYLRLFGIGLGLDLPLSLLQSDQHTVQNGVNRCLEMLRFPFTDDRVFEICALKKIQSPANS